MTKEEIILREFGNTERLEYYKRVFGMTKTRDILMDAFGKTMYGSHNSKYSLMCNSHYVELKLNNETLCIGWDWIAKLIDQQNEVHVQLSLW